MSKCVVWAGRVVFPPKLLEEHDVPKSKESNKISILTKLIKSESNFFLSTCPIFKSALLFGSFPAYPVLLSLRVTCGSMYGA